MQTSLKGGGMKHGETHPWKKRGRDKGKEARVTESLTHYSRATSRETLLFSLFLAVIDAANFLSAVMLNR